MRRVKQIKTKNTAGFFKLRENKKILLIQFNTEIYIYMCTHAGAHVFVGKKSTEHRTYTQYLGNPS